VVLVPVGQHHGLDPVQVLPDVLEVWQDQIDPRHLGVRERQARVEDEEPIIQLDAGHVAADLTDAAEECDASRAAPRPARGAWHPPAPSRSSPAPAWSPGRGAAGAAHQEGRGSQARSSPGWGWWG